MWNRDEVRGKADQLKGRVKEALGDLNNDERLRSEGQAEQGAGMVEESFGKARRKVGSAIKDLGKKVGR
jgi:uncharacterized protein YjbJ (UPF0337 family)